MPSEEEQIEMMRNIFTAIDTDGSGYIDKSELRNFMKNFAAELNQPEPSEE